MQTIATIEEVINCGVKTRVYVVTTNFVNLIDRSSCYHFPGILSNRMENFNFNFFRLVIIIEQNLDSDEN